MALLPGVDCVIPGAAWYGQLLQSLLLHVVNCLVGLTSLSHALAVLQLHVSWNDAAPAE